MHDENRLTIETLCNRPTTVKIILALLEKQEAYQFQLVRMVGTQPKSISEALEVLIENRLIRVVQPKHRIKTTGDYYALTPHGAVVARSLQDLGKTLENAK